MAVFKVGCVQNCATNNLEHNLPVVDSMIRLAVEKGAELVCLPEYYSALEQDDKAYFDNGFSQKDHPALAHGKALAAELRIWISLGSVAIKGPQRKVFNRSFMISPTGRLEARYDKIHLFDVEIKDGQKYAESDVVNPGSRAVLVDLPWGLIGLSICYDVRFPLLYRRLASAGAKFLTVPAAFTAKTGEAHWHSLLRARAIETGCFVFAAAQCGTREWGRKTYGHSLIIDPWGRVLEDAGADEGVVVAEINTNDVDQARRRIPSLEHDRDIEFPSLM